MIAGVYISQEMFANGILTALKPSLEHDRKLALRLLRLYGDQALIYSNCKFVYSRRYAAFLVKNNTPLCGKFYDYPHHSGDLRQGSSNNSVTNFVLGFTYIFQRETQPPFEDFLLVALVILKRKYLTRF